MRVSKVASCLWWQLEHTFNDGRHEQRDRVQRSIDADSDEHVDPDLPVLECMVHVLGVVLVRERRAILRQAVRDLDLLFCCQELCSRRVVVHAEKGTHSCCSVSTVDRMNGWI